MAILKHFDYFLFLHVIVQCFIRLSFARVERCVLVEIRRSSSALYPKWNGQHDHSEQQKTGLG